ncbi:Histone H4 transcription factor [Gryllus bimaculatus]|nr:Histone H4 transcription factor [Gryllus bimaculatus]
MDAQVLQESSQPFSRSERVELWLKHSEEFYQRNIGENTGKRKRVSSINDLANSDVEDDVERYSDDLILWEPRASRRPAESRKKYKWNQFPLLLKCEWLNCIHENSSLEDFVKHVSYHIPEVNIISDDKNNDIFMCQWKACEFQTSSDKEFVRHVNFHSYHTKLMAIGEKMMELLKLPKCVGNPDQRSMLPSLPAEFSCEWEDCARVFNNSQMFFFHVASHLSCYNGRKSNVKKIRDIHCCWLGCSGKFYSLCKLAEHVKVHTQEKLAACPTCGGLFASATKLHDHCMTQADPKIEFRCTSCFKYYPSERLLRDHMRRHVHYGGSKPLYCCHICNDRFFNGYKLTRHLFKYHNFQWSSGHSRFTYTRNEDGYFRLKPFRLETLEVTQEILQAEMDEHPASLSEVCGSHYSVRQITRTETAGGKRNGRGRKTVVISIDEIDKTGDVVHREVMETEEVPSQGRGGAVVCYYSEGDGMNSANVQSDTEKN